MQPNAHEANLKEVPLPAPAALAGDPYYFTFKPSAGFEGGFRLKSKQDFESLISVLNGFKTLYTKIEDIPTQPHGDDDEG